MGACIHRAHIVQNDVQPENGPKHFSWDSEHKKLIFTIEPRPDLVAYCKEIVQFDSMVTLLHNTEFGKTVYQIPKADTVLPKATHFLVWIKHRRTMEFIVCAYDNHIMRHRVLAYVYNAMGYVVIPCISSHEYIHMSHSLDRSSCYFVTERNRAREAYYMCIPFAQSLTHIALTDHLVDVVKENANIINIGKVKMDDTKDWSNASKLLHITSPDGKYEMIANFSIEKMVNGDGMALSQTSAFGPSFGRNFVVQVCLGGEWISGWQLTSYTNCVDAMTREIKKAIPGLVIDLITIMAEYVGTAFVSQEEFKRQCPPEWIRHSS